MRSFRDLKNRTWNVELNTYTVQVVKDNLRIDLLELAADEGRLMKDLSRNPMTVCNIIYWIVKDQCDTAGVDAKEFSKAWTGRIADEALPAFWAEVFDFFPKRQRETLAAAWAKLMELEERALAFVLERIQSPRVAQAMEAEMKKLDEELEKRAPRSDETSGSSPAKLE